MLYIFIPQYAVLLSTNLLYGLPETEVTPLYLKMCHDFFFYEFVSHFFKLLLSFSLTLRW